MVATGEMAGRRDGTPVVAASCARTPHAIGRPSFHISTFRLLMLLVLAVGVAAAGASMSTDAGGGIVMSAIRFASSLAGESLDWMRTSALALVATVGASPPRAMALWLGLLAMLALVPFAVVVRGLRVAVTTRRFLQSIEAAEESERTSVVTGFSRPRRAFLDRDGEDLGASFEIRGELVRIGRADDNEVVIAGAGIAALHAAITRTADWDLYLCDLTSGSLDAARVNGRRVGRHRLGDGDVISFGRVRFTYRTAAL